MNSLPLATYTELDQSTVPPAQLADYHGLITPTLFGLSDKPYLVTNVDSFKAQFGTVGPANPYFAQIKRALARGTAFYIQRLVAPGATPATVVLGASQLTLTAKQAGTWANDQVSVQYTPKGTNPIATLSISYTLDSALQESFSAGDYLAVVDLVNAHSNLITITKGAAPVEPVSSVGAPVYLATGTDGTFTAAPAKSLAIQALLSNFNNILDLTTIGVLGAYTPADAANLNAYCSGRGDVLGVCELDPNLTVAEANTAAIALAIPVGSSFLAVYWGSALSAWSPEDNALVAGPILTDVMSVFSYSDTVAGNSYRAPAGGTRGLIPNVVSFANNLLSPALVDAASTLVRAGVNVVGSHRVFGPVVWGAQTMNRKNSSLDAIHVRRMMLYLHRALQPIFDSEVFEPMDPYSWRLAYGKAKPVLQGLVADQAIYPGWVYLGDQNASNIAGATYNKQLDLANGIYKTLINLVPTGYIDSISFVAEVSNLLSLFQSTATV